jgi:anti-sigma-K factor RskA
MHEETHEQEQLLGYLLGALDDAEQQALEVRLREDARLRDALGRAKRSLRPLYATDDTPLDPPPGLAQRTCQMVERARQAASVAKAAAPQGSPVPPLWTRWLRWPGALAAAGMMVGAAALLFPAILFDRSAGPAASIAPASLVGATAQTHTVQKVETTSAQRLTDLSVLAESDQARALDRGEGPGNHPRLLLKLAQPKPTARARIRGDSKLAATAVDPDDAVTLPAAGSLSAKESSAVVDASGSHSR